VAAISAGTPAPSEPIALETARLAPVNADNPAISFVVDGQAATNTQGDDGAGFLLATGELFISAPIDPFLRGYARINGTTAESFNIEEAALVTTALPYNLTVKGGRFMADFGRFPHWRRSLAFVDRPPSIENIIGGESISEGVETSWLAPMDQFLQITFGAYNSMGADRLFDPSEFGTMPGSQRSFSQLSYLVRPLTYFDLTDTLSYSFVKSSGTLGGNLTLLARRHARQRPGRASSIKAPTSASVAVEQRAVQQRGRRDEPDDRRGRDRLRRFRRDGGYVLRASSTAVTQWAGATTTRCRSSATRSASAPRRRS
jgi:hypothetical protein